MSSLVARCRSSIEARDCKVPPTTSQSKWCQSTEDFWLSEVWSSVARSLELESKCRGQGVLRVREVWSSCERELRSKETNFEAARRNASKGCR